MELAAKAPSAKAAKAAKRLAPAAGELWAAKVGLKPAVEPSAATAASERGCVLNVAVAMSTLLDTDHKAVATRMASYASQDVVYVPQPY